MSSFCQGGRVEGNIGPGSGVLGRRKMSAGKSDEEIAARLRAAVRRRGSQRDLVRALEERGVSTTESNLANWLAGRHSPSLVQFREMCAALRVSADEVLGLRRTPAEGEEDVVFISLATSGQAAAELFEPTSEASAPWIPVGRKIVERLLGAVGEVTGRLVAAPVADLEGEAMGFSRSALAVVDREVENVADGDVHIVWSTAAGRWVLRRVYVEGGALICLADRVGWRPFTLSPADGRHIAGRVLWVTWLP